MAKPSGLHKSLLMQPGNMKFSRKNDNKNNKLQRNPQNESELIILEQQETIHLLRKLQDELVIDQRKAIKEYQEKEKVVEEQQKVIDLQQLCVSEQQMVIEQQQKQLQEQQKQLEEMKQHQRSQVTSKTNKKRVTFGTGDDCNLLRRNSAPPFTLLSNAGLADDSDVETTPDKVTRLAMAAY